MNTNGNNASSGDYRDELFRLNCLEISSESNPEYEEHSILFVDNVLNEDEQQKYEDYVFYGRNGMPNWRDYYAIKNLVETLQELDELKNEKAINLVNSVEKSFLRTLYSRLHIDKVELSRFIKSVLFSILQKLEFFFPEDDSLLRFMLKINHGEITIYDLEKAQKQYETIFQDEHYFVKDEKLLMNLCLIYFHPDKRKDFNDELIHFQNDRISEKLPELLSEVEITLI